MSQPALEHARHALGNELVQDLWVTLRSAQLYEASNATLRSAAERLSETLRALQQIDPVVRLETGEDIIEVNGVRVRSEMSTYTVHSNLKRRFAELDIGGFEWREIGDAEALAGFAVAVSRFDPEGETGHTALEKSLSFNGVEGILVLSSRGENLRNPFGDAGSRRQAGATYRMGVSVVRDLLESEREGSETEEYRVRRAVQSIVDQVLTQETLILGLTCLRDYDEPTFTHCVNVCILSVSLGQKIGLSRLELYKLGMAALLHDIGKVDVPREVLNKAGSLTDEEWQEMRRHTAYGAWRLVADRDPDTVPSHEMLAAFEHHLNVDLSGYPELASPRELAFFSKIIAIADAFDAGTTPRVYKTEPITPAEMVEVLQEHAGTRFDPVLLKAFISILGVFPSGCVCLLDTGEVAIVTAPDSNPRNLRRPHVKIIADPDGRRPETEIMVSLAEKDDAGEYARSIVNVLDPDKYDIDVQSHVVDR